LEKSARISLGSLSEGCVETTGAGATFCGSAINNVLDIELELLTELQLLDTLHFVNAAATTRKRAIRAVPVKVEEKHVQIMKGQYAKKGQLAYCPLLQLLINRGQQMLRRPHQPVGHCLLAHRDTLALQILLLPIQPHSPSQTPALKGT